MINDNSNDPFLFESKINLNDNPFLSNLNKNFNYDINFKTGRTPNSCLKLKTKIIKKHISYN